MPPIAACVSCRDSHYGFPYWGGNKGLQFIMRPTDRFKSNRSSPFCAVTSYSLTATKQDNSISDIKYSNTNRADRCKLLFLKLEMLRDPAFDY